MIFTEQTRTQKPVWLSYQVATYEALFFWRVHVCVSRTPKEMLQKIAELDYSQSQLKELNTAMRQWLDVADDDMAALRSENVALRRQVNV